MPKSKISNNTITYNTMEKIIGIIMIVIGALILVLSYVLDHFFGMGTVDQNWIQIIALILIIVGVPVHIHVVGKGSKA